MSLPADVTVHQLDVRDGAARRWTFHTAAGGWWVVDPHGRRSGPADGLRAALRACDALDPLPWCALAIEAWPHVDDVLAELAKRVVSRGDRAILDVEWHPDLAHLEVVRTDFFANQWGWLDAEVPIIVDGHECGVLDAPGGPLALLFLHDEGDLLWTSVQFRDRWLGLTVNDHEHYGEAGAGEVAPGRFAVEIARPDFAVELEVAREIPASPQATAAVLRAFLERALGVVDLSQIVRLKVSPDVLHFDGAVASRAGTVRFEGSASGPGADLMRTLAGVHQQAPPRD